MSLNLHYLIDGYNLFFSISEENPSRSTRYALIESLEQLSFKANLNTSIVFDSRSDVASDYASVLDHESIEVIYSARDQSADDYIIEFVNALKDPKRYCVVTNDKYIRLQVRDHGANTKSLSSFLELLKSKVRTCSFQKQECPLTDYDNDHLLEVFERSYRNLP